ncbi:2-oxoglutarate dehydrogenase E1 component [Priestia abyssalis]|uniref:2-oxoglutarate dehydrogenase E1 component n=1 Tax=Priestia abyssalis TaxID=1221450 RepID=UPI000995253C|nr:2-oxoglutarate dehydrogenase E1 component [Priestia abyssalis]
MGMKNNEQNPWHNFHGPNLGYVMEQYERYLTNADSVEVELKELFENWGAPSFEAERVNEAGGNSFVAPANALNIDKVVKAVKFAEYIRSYGHLAAKINPLEKSVDEAYILNPEKFGLTEEDLKAIPAKAIWEHSPDEVQTADEAIARLKEIHKGSLAYEFDHVHDLEERTWLTQMVETGAIHRDFSKEEQKELLKRLTEVEGFEQFLHRTFVGQKRFSIEGVDMLVPMLDELIKEGVHDGVHNVMIGMAHRGRLNVLAHVLGKPYGNIFSEFHHSPNKDLFPSEGSRGINYGWTGDVKYHLGGDRSIEESETIHARITLANNPSHLEFVDPVVLGFARAAQEERDKAGYPEQDVSKSFAILIHGDAAFPGQGIVAETLNLGGLRGYHTGGTIHIIANNMVGFTTDSPDSRSTKYASDLAKGYEIPVIHVNADDPQACLAAIDLAYQYRSRFKKDFLIDLVGYRRFGHNEMDDPAVTQPQLYKKINAHPTVKTLYAKKLQEQGILSAEESEKINQEVQTKLQSEYDRISDKGKDGQVKEAEVPELIAKGIPEMDTKVPLDTLREINSDLLKWPEDFNVYPKLKRILERRIHSLEGEGKVEWALAETLAFAAILQDGTPIRLTGQDSERGTFAHRHVVLNDTETGKKFSPLHRLPQAKASFSIHNSPLSEAAVVGFEYGYNVFAPETLVLWEAQYGDFANTAQALFDQFVSAGRAKWGQKSSLVLLLPHGYEGQGPEHSSARLERFLQLAAENNWTVANLTSAAQYFHILRRQAAITGTDYAQPLVIMTPKSLLRHPLTASSYTSLSEGSFQTVIEQPELGKHPEKVERLILTTGKVAIDLAVEIDRVKEKQNLDWVHVVRVEQLYPFPMGEIDAILRRYPNVKEIVWVQEEPKNMGAWHYLAPILYDLSPDNVKAHYIGRPDRSSPAGGEPNVHKKEQERIVTEALSKNSIWDIQTNEQNLTNY